jgi:VWFA-related protein
MHFFRIGALVGRRFRNSLIVAVLVMFGLVSSVGAQEAVELPQDQPTESLPEFSEQLEVHLGSVDVSVLDKGGNPISGLTRSDFVLLVDGVAREVTNLSEFNEAGDQNPGLIDESSSSSDKKGPKIKLYSPPKPGLIVILIDNDNISRANRNAVIQRLRAFVYSSVKPPHTAFVATNDNGLRRVGPLTSNPAEIMESLQSLIGKTTGASTRRGQARFAEDHIRELANRPENSRTRQIDIEQALSTARLTASHYDEGVWRAVDGLKVLLRGIGGFPGRKDVIYISDGLPMSPGVELYHLVDDLFQVHDGIQLIDEMNRSGLYNQVINYAKIAEVSLHMIDASGLQVLHGSPAETRSQTSAEVEIMRAENFQAPLYAMANSTAGVAVVNTNGFDQGFEEIRRVATAYYSLGFALEPPLRDQPHRIEVEVKDRPDAEVRFQPIFMERTIETRIAERTMSGLLLDIEENPLQIRLTTDEPVQREKDDWTVPVVVHVPVQNLTLVDYTDRREGEISIFCVSGAESGGQSRLLRSAQTVKLPSGNQSRLKSLSFKLVAAARSGENRISIGVLDESSGVTSYSAVEVACGDGG